jgi:hypothetical protein
MDNYPTALAQGWKVLPVTSLVPALDVYRNGADDSAAAGAVSLAVAQAAPSAPAKKNGVRAAARVSSALLALGAGALLLLA